MYKFLGVIVITILMHGCTQSSIIFASKAIPNQTDDELCASFKWRSGDYLLASLAAMRDRGLIDDKDREAMSAGDMKYDISRCAAVAIHKKPPTAEKPMDDGKIRLTFGGRLDLNTIYRPKHVVWLKDGKVTEWT